MRIYQFPGWIIIWGFMLRAIHSMFISDAKLQGNISDNVFFVPCADWLKFTADLPDNNSVRGSVLQANCQLRHENLQMEECRKPFELVLQRCKFSLAKLALWLLFQLSPYAFFSQLRREKRYFSSPMACPIILKCCCTKCQGLITVLKFVSLMEICGLWESFS